MKWTRCESRRRCGGHGGRGMAIIVALAWVILIAGVVAAAGQALSGWAALRRDAAATQTMGNHFDATIRRLRADVGGASELAVPDESRLILKINDDLIFWKVKESQLIRGRIVDDNPSAGSEWE